MSKNFQPVDRLHCPVPSLTPLLFPSPFLSATAVLFAILPSAPPCSILASPIPASDRSLESTGLVIGAPRMACRSPPSPAECRPLWRQASFSLSLQPLDPDSCSPWRLLFSSTSRLSRLLVSSWNVLGPFPPSLLLVRQVHPSASARVSLTLGNLPEGRGGTHLQCGAPEEVYS